MQKRLFIFLFACVTVSLCFGQTLLSAADPAAARQRFISCAQAYMGTKWVSGGLSKKGIDCSGLVYNAALESSGQAVPRTAAAIYKFAESVADQDIEPGDLLFFNTVGGISHVGIYLGGGQFIHSASAGSKTGVIVSNLTESYWKRTYVSAGRIFESAKTQTVILASEDTPKSVPAAPASSNIATEKPRPTAQKDDRRYFRTLSGREELVKEEQKRKQNSPKNFY